MTTLQCLDLLSASSNRGVIPAHCLSLIRLQGFSWFSMTVPTDWDRSSCDLVPKKQKLIDWLLTSGIWTVYGCPWNEGALSFTSPIWMLTVSFTTWGEETPWLKTVPEHPPHVSCHHGGKKKKKDRSHQKYASNASSWDLEWKKFGTSVRKITRRAE